MKPGDLISVTWVDVATHPGWQRDAGCVMGVLNETYGRLVNQDESYTRVAGTMCVLDSTYADVTAIPNVLIVGKVKKLK